MGTARSKLLIVEDNPDNRFLLTKTLVRKFPDAEILECDEIGMAVDIARCEQLTAIVSHRADLTDGIELICQLRRVNADVPIIMVSGFDRSREAFAAGATRFLPYDEWLRIGTVMAEVLALGKYASIVSRVSFAIERRNIITFAYGDSGRRREVEPHLLGATASGEVRLRAYSATRASSHPLHTAGWQTYTVDAMHDLAITERLFAPHPDDALRDASITRTICEIKGTASGFIPRAIAR